MYQKSKPKSRKKIFLAILIIIGLMFLIYAATKAATKNKVINSTIAVIPVKGVISFSNSGLLFQQSNANAQSILDNIEKAKSKNVKAVVFEIDSPGGTVVASKEIAEAIRKLDKPTVSVIRETGASGAYWIAASTDKIVADDLSITGSIGVISSYLEFYEFLDKNGVKYNRLVAGKYKDMGSPFKDLSDEERDILQKKLDLIHEIFIDYVKERRNLTDVEVNKIRTGEFFLGREAKDIHLIDYIGNKEFAIELAKNMGDAENARITEFREKRTLLDIFSSYGAETFYYMGRGIGAELADVNINKESSVQLVT